MPEDTPSTDLLNIEPSAQSLIQSYGVEFVETILTRARIKAFAERSRVTTKHVQEAWYEIRNVARSRQLRILREALIFFGGTLFSVLVQSILTTQTVPVTQVAIGISGLFLVGFAWLFIEP